MAYTIQEWDQEFQKNLGATRRWDGFRFIAEQLSSVKNVLIMETGCIRSKNDWAGNGQSTMVWDWIANKNGGWVAAIDKDAINIALAKTLVSPRVNLIYGDSIEMLCKSRRTISKAGLHLLFLDSFDHDPPYAPSELHHGAELATIYDNLPSGCLIAVDDCNHDQSGKHVVVKWFFNKLGIKPLLESYMHVWRKP